MSVTPKLEIGNWLGSAWHDREKMAVVSNVEFHSVAAKIGRIRSFGFDEAWGSG